MYHNSMPGTTADQVAITILETLPPSMRAIREQMRAGRVDGMSVAQFRLLIFVRRNPGTSLSPLAEHLATSLPAASQLVERLVQIGMLTRGPHPASRRRIEVHLTPAGAAALAQCDARTRSWLCERLSGLDEADLGRIQSSLRELSDLLTDDGA
jgi:DNA-binding MarR family transcriptional regulator